MTLTRAETNLEWLKGQYVLGRLSLAGFEASVAANLGAQREGWGRESPHGRMSAKEAARRWNAAAGRASARYTEGVSRVVVP